MPRMAPSSGLLTGNAGERRQASADGAEQGPSQAPRRIEVAAAAAPRRARFHAGKAGGRAVFADQADCWAFPPCEIPRGSRLGTLRPGAPPKNRSLPACRRGTALGGIPFRRVQQIPRRLSRFPRTNPALSSPIWRGLQDTFYNKITMSLVLYYK